MLLTDFIKKPEAIASRLTLWYALLSVILIASAGSILYWVLTDRLRQEDDRLLESRIAEVSALLMRYAPDSDMFMDELQREANTGLGIYLRVQDFQGNNVTEAIILNVDFGGDKPYPPIRENGKGEDWVSSEGEVYRTMSFRIAVASGFTVQAIMSLAKEEEVLTTYLRTLWIVVSIALVLAIVAGYLIARRSLKPVSRLAHIVAELTAAHLHRRVATDEWPRELQPLASNFDLLLSRLEESFDRISRFSADIAHELRTPLHVLRGEAEMALTKGRTADDYRTCIESAVEEYERLSRMVDALLFLARTEQPDMQLDKQLLDFKHEAAAVCGFYQAMADEGEVILSVYGEGNVFTDSALLRRALGNLVANSLRHTHNGKHVIIEARKTQNNGMEITVRDTGDGIASGDLPYVLDRFYRADDARTRCDLGTGLGLAIVNSIMQLHGGTVSIQSEQHHGTVVKLSFPPQSTPSVLGHL